MPKKESQNYQAVSVIVVLLMFCAMVAISLAGLSHAFNIGNAGGGTPDEGYVITNGEPQ